MSDVVYVPPAQEWMSPYPQALVPDYTGAEAGTGWGSAASTLTDLPTPYDLSWVAGDTAYFSFFFQNVCWVPVEPTPTHTLPWENVSWRSQVRSQQTYYWGYWWPPTWPLGAYIMEFTVTPQYTENDPNLGTGTLVTIKGGIMWPGTYQWDLQSEHHLDVNNPESYEAHTRVAGKATIVGQVTNPQVVPPGYWPAGGFPLNSG